MDVIFSQTPPLFLSARLPIAIAPVSAVALVSQRDRIDHIVALSPEDATAGLLWLAMNFPAVCDAMLDKVECDAIDDPDPAPVNPAAPSHRGAASLYGTTPAEAPRVCGRAS
jgi:hypothetical protein